MTIGGSARRVAVRGAEVADAPAIGEVHVRAWQEAYPGLLPQDHLDALSVDERADLWHEQLADASPTTGPRTAVATLDGRVVGFCVHGRPAEDLGKGVGEVFALDVHPDAWGSGVGRALLRDAHAALVRYGYREAVLWVAPGNARARRFCETHGWVGEDVERTEEVLGAVVPEVRYHRDLEATLH